MTVLSDSGMKVGVTIKRNRALEVRAQMAALASSEVLVGIPGSTTERKPEPHQQWDWNGQKLTRRTSPVAEEPTNAELGYIHEFGAPEAGIPPRPFLIPGVRNALSASLGFLREGAKRALKGHPEAASQAQHRAGLAAQNSVRNKINNGPFEPLKESTLAARRAKGRTGIKPLIDTGALRSSITYVIRAVNARRRKK